MIKYIKLLVLFITISLTSCTEKTCNEPFKFSLGDDVKIKNKTFHNSAVVTKVNTDDDCSKTYEVSYFSHLGIKRTRVVTEFEIEKDNA